MKQENYLFEEFKNPNWQDEWENMPEYNNIKIPSPVIVATFKFRNEDSFNKFNKLSYRFIRHI